MSGKIRSLLILLALIVIPTIFRLTVIEAYISDKRIELAEMKQIKDFEASWENRIQEHEFNYISELMFKMYENKDSLNITDDSTIENKQELVNQFIEEYEVNYLNAHRLVSELDGVITFVEKLEPIASKPQARYCIM